MFPIRDDNPTKHTPWMTFLLIAACAAVWVFVQGAGFSEAQLLSSVTDLGAVPARLDTTPDGAWLTLVTSMFLHGGWAHLIGNLWFLWIFGNNIEDDLGPGRFLVFYVACGIVAALAHLWSEPGSNLPMVGASGAISGVMGAYLLRYPRARIHTLFFLLIFFTVADLPAWVYLVYWFLIQLAASQIDVGTGGGIAFWAHIGGFAAGMVLLPLLQPSRRR